MDFDDNFKGDMPTQQLSSVAYGTSRGVVSRSKDKDITDPKPIEELAAQQ